MTTVRRVAVLVNRILFTGIGALNMPLATIGSTVVFVKLARECQTSEQVTRLVAVDTLCTTK